MLFNSNLSLKQNPSFIFLTIPGHTLIIAVIPAGLTDCMLSSSVAETITIVEFDFNSSLSMFIALK